MILRLCLYEQAIVHRYGTRFYRFHREELLIHVLHKLAFGILHSYLGDSVFGREECRWGEGYNFMLRHLDESFGDLVNINSLSICIDMFSIFTEAVRPKHSTLWKKLKMSRVKIFMVALTLLMLWLNGPLCSRNMPIRVRSRS